MIRCNRSSSSHKIEVVEVRLNPHHTQLLLHPGEKMSAKRVKRIRQTNAEYEDAVQKTAQQSVLTTVEDQALFTVDRAGSKAKRRRVVEEILPKEEGKFVSSTEKHLIEKQRKRLESGTVRKPYGSDYVEVGNKKTVTKVEDIWGEEEESKPATSSRRARLHKQSLKIALPGQSYNPSAPDHQDALAQAMSIHLKKIENAKTAFDLIEEQQAVQKEKRDQALVLAGDSSDDDEDSDDDNENKSKSLAKYAVDSNKLKTMTAVLLDENDSGDSEDEDSDLESNDEDGNSSGAKKPRQKVLTKAQRNKRRARRQAEHEARRAAVEKKKLLDIVVVKHIKKNIAQENAEHAVQRKIKEALEIERKRAEEEEKTKRLRAYEVSAVPLSDELQGSLRAMKPKGAPSLDAMQSMIASGETRAAFARKRRAYEKPHGAKRIKWVPKYKV